MAQAAASSLRWAAMLFYVYMMTHLFALVCAAVFAIFCESAAEVGGACALSWAPWTALGLTALNCGGLLLLFATAGEGTAEVGTYEQQRQRQQQQQRARALALLRLALLGAAVANAALLPSAERGSGIFVAANLLGVGAALGAAALVFYLYFAQAPLVEQQLPPAPLGAAALLRHLANPATGAGHAGESAAVLPLPLPSPSSPSPSSSAALVALAVPPVVVVEGEEGSAGGESFPPPLKSVAKPPRLALESLVSANGFSEEKTELFQLYCPICMLFFDEVYRVGCCGNHICEECAIEYVRGKSEVNTMSHSQLLVAELRQLAGDHFECPYCSRCGELSLSRVEPSDAKRYEDSPLPSRLGQQRGTAFPSPLKVGDSFETLKGKMVGFETVGYHSATVDTLNQSPRRSTPSEHQQQQGNTTVTLGHDLIPSSSDPPFPIAGETQGIPRAATPAEAVLTVPVSPSARHSPRSDSTPNSTRRPSPLGTHRSDSAPYQPHGTATTPGEAFRYAEFGAFAGFPVGVNGAPALPGFRTHDSSATAATLPPRPQLSLSAARSGNEAQQGLPTTPTTTYPSRAINHLVTGDADEELRSATQVDEPSTQMSPSFDNNTLDGVRNSSLRLDLNGQEQRNQPTLTTPRSLLSELEASANLGHGTTQAHSGVSSSSTLMDARAAVSSVFSDADQSPSTPLVQTTQLPHTPTELH